MVDAGVPTGVIMAPILPGLSDRRDQIEATVAAIQDAGAEVFHAHPVYLRGATREHFMSWLYDHDRELHARYVRGISERGDVSREYKKLGRRRRRPRESPLIGEGTSDLLVQQPRQNLNGLIGASSRADSRSVLRPLRP